MNTTSKMKTFLRNSAAIATFDKSCGPCSFLLPTLRTDIMKIVRNIIGHNTVRIIDIIDISKTITGSSKILGNLSSPKPKTKVAHAFT